MPLGVLEDLKLAHVPGTSYINDTRPLHRTTSGSETNVVVDTSNLKHAKGKHSHIILIPQPSQDPNDPLNWPRWKKELLFWPMIFATGLVGAIGPLLTPGFVQLSVEFGVSVDKISSSLQGSLIIAIGVAMFPMASFAQKYGRRPVFLLASAVLFATSIWCGATTSLNSLTAARVLQGASMAPLEALITATIGDIYFVHERGLRLAIWTFAINAGIAVAPIVNGALIQDLGWQWCFWIIAILFGISFILMFLTFPETAYKRTTLVDSYGSAADNLRANTTETNSVDREKDEEIEQISVVPSSLEAQSATPKARTWKQDLRIFSGTYSDVSILKLIARPFPFVLSPVVIWGTLAYGFTSAWLVILSVTESLIFSLPPYDFDSQSVGLVSIGSLIGGILATIVSGPFCDWCATGFSKLNGGVYEPEFRLFLVIPMIICEVMAYVVWGVIQTQGKPWIGPVVLIGIIGFGQGLGSTAIVSYVVDVHRDNVPEAFAVINFIKNMLAFGCTYFVNSWIETQGVFNTLATLSGLCAVCLVPTLPMYIFGKRVRSWIHRHPRVFLTD